MLCHTVHNVYKNCLQDGVGTSPGATIKSWKKKKKKFKMLPKLVKLNKKDDNNKEF